MKKAILILVAVLIVSAIGIYAHTQVRYGDMHEDMEKIIESGNYENLEVLRQEYGMPIMYWIDEQQEFEEAKESYEKSGSPLETRYGGCHR